MGGERKTFALKETYSSIAPPLPADSFKIIGAIIRLTLNLSNNVNLKVIKECKTDRQTKNRWTDRQIDG